MSFKETLKKTPGMVAGYHIMKATSHYFRFRPFSFVSSVIGYSMDYVRLKKSARNANFKLQVNDLLPCLFDKTENTPMDPIYFYQDTWGAGKVFKLKPSHHYDIGSSAKTVGIISQFVPTTMVDIRPIELTIPGLSFIKGSILALPFESNTVESISSLCVIEHIGLGRYGDPIDSYGSEKAISEIVRVVKPGGTILFSVPVDAVNKIYFNAHRAFTREYILNLFKDCHLNEEKYIYGKKMMPAYEPQRGFGVGLYHFIKK